MSPAVERRLLQAVIVAGGIVPVGAGLLGAAGRMGHGSHVRYLSGLLLGIGLALWAMVPSIERRAEIFRTLAAIIFIGGLARLGGIVQEGGHASDFYPLALEIAATPLLAIWRERVERRFNG